MKAKVEPINEFSRVDAGLALALVALAAGARLLSLSDSPGWYHDETIYIGEAWNLIHGRFQWDAVQHTFLPRLPLFHLIAGPLLLLFGKDILWVRLIAALSGVGMTWVIFRVARESAGRAGAVAGAFAFAVSSYTVLLTRWGMSYALDAFLGAANLYLLIRYARFRNRRYYWLAISTAALGIISDPVMVSHVVATFIVIFFISNWRKAAMAFVSMIVPLTIYITYMMLVNREIFIEDVNIIIQNRLSSKNDWYSFVLSLKELLKCYGGYGFLGLAGLLFLKNETHRRVILLVFILDTLAVLKLTVEDVSLSYRMGIILAPVLFIGLGALLQEIWSRVLALLAHEGKSVAQLTKNPESAERIFALSSTMICWTAIISLSGLLIIELFKDVRLKFPSMDEHYRKTVVRETKAARNAATWLNERLGKNDLVMTTHVEWMLKSRTASPMLVNLYEGGEGSDVYFEGLKDRFIYPCSLKNTRYFISHDAMPRIASIYKVEDLVRRIQKEWKSVYRDDLTRIYENPDASP